MTRPLGDDDESEAPTRGPAAARGFFDLDFRAVTSGDRTKTLTRLAAGINGWYNDSKYVGGSQPPDAMVLLMPEGFGKSHLVVELVSRGFKVVFCTKSNSQLVEKERSIGSDWGLKTTRYISKGHHLQVQLDAIGIGPSAFKLVTLPNENPYAEAAVDEQTTFVALAAAFEKEGLKTDPVEFYRTHYDGYDAPPLDGSAADVVLITLAAFQAMTTSRKLRWWERLGLVARTRTVTIDEDSIDRFSRKHRDLEVGDQIEVNVPFKKVAIIVDDPDRGDVDWLRGLSKDAAQKLRDARARVTARQLKGESASYWNRRFGPENSERLAALTRARNESRRSTPIHKIVDYKERSYIERALIATIGYRLRGVKFRPKVIVTTTEWITGYFALQTLRRSGLRVVDHVDVFHTVDCIVTAISTTITRKANHAVLLPIMEKLRNEFPQQQVALIADGLGCQLTLSSNKGRNDLSETNTIIKLSWPHPNITATLGAHFGEVDDHDLMVATLLGDLGNQAIGRNQGFRFRGKQAIVLIDPKYFAPIMKHGLIRYKMTPWSSKLPAFNKKTSKKSSLESISYSIGQSALEKRLLELIHDFHAFGLSEEAKALAERLPERQQAHYNKWLAENGSPERMAAELEKLEAKRARVAENVRLHRQRKKAAVSPKK
jgi:hypothetical protein